MIEIKVLLTEGGIEEEETIKITSSAQIVTLFQKGRISPADRDKYLADFYRSKYLNDSDEETQQRVDNIKAMFGLPTPTPTPADPPVYFPAPTPTPPGYTTEGAGQPAPASAPVYTPTPTPTAVPRYTTEGAGQPAPVPAPTPTPTPPGYTTEGAGQPAPASATTSAPTSAPTSVPTAGLYDESLLGSRPWGGDEAPLPFSSQGGATNVTLPNIVNIPSEEELTAQEETDKYGVLQRFLHTEPKLAGLSPFLIERRLNRLPDVFSQHLLANLVRAGNLQEEAVDTYGNVVSTPEQSNVEMPTFEDFLRGGGTEGFTPELGRQGVDLLSRFFNLEKAVTAGGPASEGWEQLSSAAHALLGDQDLLENALIQSALNQTAPGFRAPLRRGAAKQFRLFRSLHPGAPQQKLIDFARRTGYS